MSGYLPIITLDLVCREDYSDEQRVLHLRSEMVQFYGRPVDFHAGIAGPYGLGAASAERPAVNAWGIERVELNVARSLGHANEVVLHESAATNRGVTAEVEVFLEHLVAAGIVDLATFLAFRHVRRFRLFGAMRATYVCLGRRASIYIFYRKLAHGPRHAPDTITTTHMSYWEMVDCISKSIENSVASVALSDVRGFIKGIDEELRAKLSAGEFQRLIASFG